MKSRIAVFTLAILAGMVARQSAIGADYSGLFQGDGLIVRLSADEGRYTGAIQMGDKTFTCTAREVGGRLRGTFISNEHPFEFTALLRDGTLTLESGGTTYTLRRQAAPVNPLSRAPAAVPVGGEAEAIAGRAAGLPQSAVDTNAAFLRFKRVSVADRQDMIGGEAFSFLAPAGWQVEGGLVWRLHPVMPAAVAMRVRNPEGLEQLECFPTLGFSWGGYTGPGTAFPPGANYLGNEVQPPVRDALAYLKERHIPRTRGRFEPRITRTEELPKLAAAVREAEAQPEVGGTDMVLTAGRVRVEYELDGKPVEEDLYCVLNSVTLAGGSMTIQIADKLYGLRAARGRLEQATKLFETVIRSARPNLHWFNRYTQLVQALTQAQMDRIRAAGELSRYISRTSSEISDMMRQSYEERQAAQDRINRNWSLYMRGVDEYHDPVTGRPVELPGGYKNAWVSRNGEYIVTDSVNFDPNVQLDGTWQRLERRAP